MSLLIMLHSKSDYNQIAADFYHMNQVVNM